MEPVEPLQPESRDLLAGYRRQTPGDVPTQDNWAAVERKLAHGRANDEHGYPTARGHLDDEHQHQRIVAITSRGRLQRVARAGGLSIAIAACVLLLVRGTLAGVSALATERADEASQAADVEQPRGNGGAWASGRDGADASRTMPVERAPAAEVAPTPVVPVVRAEEAASPAALPRRAVAPSESAPAVDDAAPPVSLAEQTKLLSAARTAVAAQRYADALRLSRAYRKHFPNGALLEEHMAIEAIARCKMGDDGAEATAAFFAAYAGSPHAPRVRSACDPAR